MDYTFDLFFLILIPGCFYLSTLAPSIGYQDTPEFVDTSFALGIIHPAGFPAYNLISKAITFLPLGSIAFRVNLFSTLLACMTLVVLYLSAIEIIKICFPESSSESRIGPALFSPALLAFSFPFWFNSLIAEVYTLHSFFTVLIIYLLLLWKNNNDSRFLLLAALFFGLSAGNHGTVAFYLPAILFLFRIFSGPVSTTSALFSAFLIISGLQFLLFAMWFDMENNKSLKG